jgi:hypothetical protein
MADEDLEGTLDELLAFVEARRLTRTLPDGRQFVWNITRGLTAEEVDQVFMLDRVAGVLAKKLGLSLPAAPARLGPHESYLPCTHLRYQCGPRMVLCPTREWVAEIKAVRSVARAVAERESARTTDRPFFPTDRQKRILDLLDGKTKKLAQLAQVLKVQPSTLSGRDLKELRARGLVRHDRRIGYYRPDAPPPKLSGTSR